ncbi:transcription initiation factor TFIID 23-30kDa subunit-domain-containing protein [Talaromyces proteolyticus]|uniref:Transcription initiation factor TFIID subunit 10 n=1 Tax=Talaromyces proteolyticus TaxID=1131652 RepID=A0AAD4L4Z7_9EURO|nr:transcription initiation factor TFIID 23-30kDa subunit-domain-containing protein [Talaromyces proteolyticus]KAH8705151.1 transcription initiation factor TFIID 23-30kDa subunit-domain-containing protein [Talaromyces proteolyticus]
MSDPSPSSQPPPGSQLPTSTQPTQSQEAPSSSSGTAVDQTEPNSTNIAPSAQPPADRETDAADDPIDAGVDNDIDMNAAESGTGANGTAAGGDPDAPGNPVASLSGAGGPTKKESSLREFLGKMDEYAPIIPDAVTAHYLTVAGLPPPGNGPNQTPPHLARLLALATQKFVADIAADAYQYSRIRASNSSSANNPMGGLNAAAGLNMPNTSATGGAAGAGGGGEGGKKGGATNTSFGIQRPGFGGGGQGGSGQGRTVLTMEDLGMAVSEYGVSVKRGEFYR